MKKIPNLYFQLIFYLDQKRLIVCDIGHELHYKSMWAVHPQEFALGDLEVVILASFAPIPKFDDRFARQNCCGPPPEAIGCT